MSERVGECYLGAGDKSLSSSSFDLLDFVDDVVEGVTATNDLVAVGVTTIGKGTSG